MSDSDADDGGNLIDVEDAGYDEFLLDSDDEDETKPPSRRASQRKSIPALEPDEPAWEGKKEAAANAGVAMHPDADSSAKRKPDPSDPSDDDDDRDEGEGGRRRGKFVSERSDSKAPAAKRARVEPADRRRPPRNDRDDRGRGRGSGPRVDTTTVPLQLPPALPALLGAGPGGPAPPSRASRPSIVQPRDGPGSGSRSSRIVQQRDGPGSGSRGSGRGSGMVGRPPTVRRDGPGSGSRGGGGLLTSPPGNGGLARPPNMPIMGGAPRGFMPPGGYGSPGCGGGGGHGHGGRGGRGGGFGPSGPMGGRGFGPGGPMGGRGPPMGGGYGAGAPLQMGVRPSPAPAGRQRVKIANLSAATKGKMLLDHLETIATVTKMTKKGSVADVEFETKEMALKAKRQLDRTVFDGSRISMTLD